MTLTVIITLAVLGTQTARPSNASPLNAYTVFLDKHQIQDGCSITDAEHFRNRAYTFRGRMHRDLPLVLHGGKALELSDAGKPEWETELIEQTVVMLGGQPAVMLRLMANHVGGTGSWGTVLIGTCNDRQLTVVFEAEGLGVRDAAFTADEVLVVKRLAWSKSDAHCCPSGKAEERYRWDRHRRRFVPER